MTSSKTLYWIVLAVTATATAMVYAPGLDGPFLFDDSTHITQNRWVQIKDLDWQSLLQAWNSSFNDFPSNRPLAQASFGVNHALAGLDPWSFKATNLALHLLSGLLVFVFVRFAFRAIGHAEVDARLSAVLAAATAAVWLLHPIHVSTVLYTVQRMALISNLGMLLGLVCYLYGRIRIAEGRQGAAWMLAAAPIALIGFLGKENAVLMPLLLLVCELTLLRGLSPGNCRGFIRTVWVGYIALPLVIGTAYVAGNPELFSYEGRAFTLEQRLLTQPRVLWTYVQWLFIPDITAFGLFHDDLQLSTGWTTPPTTLLAAAGLLIILIAALTLRKTAPVFAFAVLFYLANHALESTIFPLEMMFEHRNYLASLGPLLLLSWLVVVVSARFKVRRLALVVGALLLLSYSAVTHLRVADWSSYRNFVFSTVENHPESRRSNFMAAQLLIAMIGQSIGDTDDLEAAARQFLLTGLRLDEGCIDCLFGLVALDLHVGRQPHGDVIGALRDKLRTGDVGPTHVAVTQFSFLARWHKGDGTKLSVADVTGIYDAALANPGWNYTGRASIEAAYREYHEFVSGDLTAAERHARAAIAAWPQQWGYHAHLISVLRKQDRPAVALAALDEAATAVRNARQQAELANLRDMIRRDLEKKAHASQ